MKDKQVVLKTMASWLQKLGDGRTSLVNVMENISDEHLDDSEISPIVDEAKTLMEDTDTKMKEGESC